MSASVVAALEEVARRHGARAGWREGARRWSLDDILRAAEDLAGSARRAGAREGALWVVEGEGPAAAFAGGLGVRLAGAVPLLAAPGAAFARAAGLLRVDVGLRAVGATVLGGGLPLPRGTAWVRPTGGTTGDPKLVAFDEGGTLAGARASVALLGLEPGDAVATTVPPWTAFGWNSGACVPLLAGGEVRAVPPVSPRDLVEEARVAAWTVTTPPVVRALARVGASAEGGRPVRVLVAGGAYPGEEAERLGARGIAVIDRYGCTEVGPIAQAREPLGSLHAAPGLYVRPVGDPPSIEVGGAAVALGYAEAGGERARGFGGTFRTPDLGRFHADGSFRVLGRADRAIKRMGRVVDLARVEREVARAPGVALARVRAERGSLDAALVAVVVPRAGQPFDADGVLRWVVARLDPWERPEAVEVATEVPAGAEAKWTAAEEGAP